MEDMTIEKILFSKLNHDMQLLISQLDSTTKEKVGALILDAKYILYSSIKKELSEEDFESWLKQEEEE